MPRVSSLIVKLVQLLVELHVCSCQMHILLIFCYDQIAERSYCEDIRFFLEGPFDKYEQAQFSGNFILHESSFISPIPLAWRLHQMTHLRTVWQVNVRSFGHRNPLEEYKIDGCRFFISMLSATRRMTVESLLHYWSSPMESTDLYAPWKSNV